MNTEWSLFPIIKKQGLFLFLATKITEFATMAMQLLQLLD